MESFFRKEVHKMRSIQTKVFTVLHRELRYFLCHETRMFSSTHEMASEVYLCSFLLLFWRFSVQRLQVIYSPTYRVCVCAVCSWEHTTQYMPMSEYLFCFHRNWLPLIASASHICWTHIDMNMRSIWLFAERATDATYPESDSGR